MAAYVRDLWYMVAWEEEVPEEGVLTRTILDRRMAFYRKRDGGYAGLVDRCPHRFAPLSMGSRDGDALVCGYHGLTFDETGACIRNPFSATIPSNCSVESFATVARDGMLWMWNGERAAADPARIPDFSMMGNDVPQGRGHLNFAADYEVMTDNLMDLTHLEFLHANSFGGAGVIFRGSYTSSEEADGTIWSRWWMPDTRPEWASHLPADMKTDHWMEIYWNAPGAMLLEIGLCPAGRPREEAPAPPICGSHVVTPETEGRAHYFYAFVQYHGDVDDNITLRAFKNEDQPMLEAVQREMGDADFWDLKPVILHVDGAGIRARRHLARLRREQEGAEVEALAAE
ncbi:MAG: aromatic ring-hydroxylating dioxygenase subunit alpha [Sphingomonas sp.]